MKIGELGGEFALIDRIAARGSGATHPLVAVGIGDDAAVLFPPAPDSRLLVTTDLLIEDRHFRRVWADPYHLGWKAVAVNLSDIAAMGGTPTATFISLALPDTVDVAFVDELYRGIGDACLRYGSTVAGGDTNASPGPLVVNVTQLGTAPASGVWLRSTARPGDLVLVTGELGASAAGLALLEENGRQAAEAVCEAAVRAQIAPLPRLPEAHAAVTTGGVTAAIDLSDGLLADLAKLCRASGVGAQINPALVPVSPSARQVAAFLHREAPEWALRGGEDYELLLTAAPQDAARISAAITGATGTPVSVIGTITAGEGVLLGGDSPAATAKGWDHFAPA